MNVRIFDAQSSDAAAIAALYNAYVRGTVATFEVDEVPVYDMARRIGDVRARGLPWFALEADGAVRGYACATPWKTRAAYARSVETSIYLDAAACGHGWGRRLYATLLDRLCTMDMHLAIAGIALPNPASVRLHEALGFAPVGIFREVGFKLDRWIDVGYWQLPLRAERADAVDPTRT